MIYGSNTHSNLDLQGGINMANKKKADDNLTGTLLMTFAVGLVIIIIWAYCFGLFAGRF